ncbi:MAG: tetratricopeptide repeat protein [Phycisphaerae bacterium]|nr:tetratricopeptide repeat protein [Phycisphaerae bacterium]
MRTVSKKKGAGKKSRRALKPAVGPPKLLPVAAAPWWQWWAAALMVMAAAVVVYLPTLDNGFVTWDDPDYITKNRYISDPAGLSKIWDPKLEHEQYYPLVFSSYWLEYQVWEFNPRGYHLTNLVLHALNAGLLIWVLRLLGVRPWAAWLVAGLFAVHPINVASVAWAAERKNVLSTLFYLPALACYLRNTRRRNWLIYGLSLLLFILGLLSKTAVLTLPATALLCDRLILRRWSWQSLARVLPLLVLAVYAARHTQLVEQANSTSMVPLDDLLRPLAAAGAIWFYVGKMFVPVNFPGIHPRWDIQASWPIFAAALAALPLAGLMVWKLRRRLSGHALWGMGHFLLSLGPMLGLIPFNYTQYSFVADHYVYIAGIGVFLGVAAGADFVRRRFKIRLLGTGVATALACVVLAGLGAVSWRQNTQVWKNAKSFWINTVTLNSGCFPGQYNLANLYAREGNKAAAAEHYRLAALARPDMHLPVGARARMLFGLGDLEGAVETYHEALAKVPFPSKKWVDYRHELAGILIRLGRPAEAERYLREAVDRKPFLYRVRLELARFLRDRGRLDEAIHHYQQALNAKDAPQNPNPTRRELEALQRAQQR